jgi:hypothetical protein
VDCPITKRCTGNSGRPGRNQARLLPGPGMSRINRATCSGSSS